MTARVPLDPAAVDRLAKLAGLLGSSFPGEHAVAAEKASQVLKAAGLSWRELVERAFRAPPASTPSLSREPERWKWREIAEDLADGPYRLTSWEVRFIESLLDQDAISERQWAVLRDLARKVAL